LIYLRKLGLEAESNLDTEEVVMSSTATAIRQSTAGPPYLSYLALNRSVPPTVSSDTASRPDFIHESSPSSMPPASTAPPPQSATLTIIWDSRYIGAENARSRSYRAKYLTAPSNGLLHIKYYGVQTRGYDIELSYYHQSQLDRTTETRAETNQSAAGCLPKLTPMN